MDGVFVGQVILVAFNFTPKGFFPCDGRSLDSHQFVQLYSLINNTYGGTDTTFNLPNASSMTVVPGFHYVICYQGEYPTRP